MTGPWDDYGNAAGPWSDYATPPAPAKSRGVGGYIADEIGGAWTGAVDKLKTDVGKAVEGQRRRSASGEIDWNPLRKVAETAAIVKDAVEVPLSPFAGAIHGAIVKPYGAAMSGAYNAMGVPATSDEFERSMNTALMAAGPGKGGVARVAEVDPIRAAASAAIKPQGPIARAVAPLKARLSQSAAEQQAGRVLAERATDLPAARANLASGAAEIVPGSKPTTFQQTGDMGLGALEREVSTRNPADFMQRRAEQNVARVSSLDGVQSGADPLDVSRHLKSHLDEIDAQTETAVAKASQTAQERAAAIGGTGTPESHGEALRGAIAEAETAARTREGALWKAIDPEGDLTGNVSTTIQSAKEIAGALPKTAKPLAGEEAAIFQAAGDLTPLAPVSDLIALRSRVSTELRNELIANGRSPAYARLSQLRGAIQDNLGSSISDAVKADEAAVARGDLAPEAAIGAKLQAQARDWQQQRKQARTAVGGDAGAGDSRTGAPGVSGLDGTAQPASGGPGSPARDQGLPSAEGPSLGAQPVLARHGATIESHGDNGPVLRGLEGNWSGAVESLRSLKSGDAVGALSHPDVGPIDVVWGNEKGGLAHILSKPGGEELVRTLPEVLARSKVVPGGRKRVFLEDPDNRTVLALDYEGKEKRWLLTSYEKGMGQSGGGRIDRAPVSDPAVAAPKGSPDRLASENIGASGPDGNSPSFDAAAKGRLDAATVATKERARTFGLAPVSQVTAKAGASDIFRLPDGQIPGKFFHPGPAGFEHVQSAMKASKDALPILEDYAAASLKRAALREDGSIDPAKFQRWSASHQDALRALPDGTRKRFADSASAGRALAEAGEARAEAMKAAQTGAVGRVMGLSEPADVTKTIGTLLNGRTAVADIKQLAGRTGRDANARAGLRQAIVDHIQGKLIGNTEGATSGVAQLKADAFQTFMRDKRPALQQVFSGDEINRMEAIAADIQRSKRSETAVRLPGQSNSAQDFIGATKGQPTHTGRSFLSAVASAFGAIGAGPGGAFAAALGADFLQGMRAAGVARVDQLVTKAMLDPEVARVLLAQVPTKASPRLMGAKSSALLRALGVGVAASAAANSGKQSKPAKNRLFEIANQ